MSAMAKMVMRKFYREAEGYPERLPWHRHEPGPCSKRVIAAPTDTGRALDVGCGAGVFSVWLADEGMEVTAIDVFPEAIAMCEPQPTTNGHGAVSFIAHRPVCVRTGSSFRRGLRFRMLALAARWRSRRVQNPTIEMAGTRWRLCTRPLGQTPCPRLASNWSQTPIPNIDRAALRAGVGTCRSRPYRLRRSLSVWTDRAWDRLLVPPPDLVISVNAG